VNSRGELLARIVSDYGSYASFQEYTRRTAGPRAAAVDPSWSDRATTDWQPFQFTFYLSTSLGVCKADLVPIQNALIRSALGGAEGIQCVQFAPRGRRVWCALFPADATAYLFEIDQSHRPKSLSMIETYYLGGKIAWAHTRHRQVSDPFPLPPPANMKPLGCRIDAAVDDVACGDCHTVRLEAGKPRHYDPNEIRSIRDKLRMSPPIFGSLLGVSGAMVTYWEVGKSTPPPVVRRLLDRLRVDPGGTVADLIAEPTTADQ
jgi:DNA-binding transcriptional regulator YiaG